jgi:hypothetical protein
MISVVVRGTPVARLAHPGTRVRFKMRIIRNAYKRNMVGWDSQIEAVIETSSDSSCTDVYYNFTYIFSLEYILCFLTIELENPPCSTRLSVSLPPSLIHILPRVGISPSLLSNRFCYLFVYMQYVCAVFAV